MSQDKKGSELLELQSHGLSLLVLPSSPRHLVMTTQPRRHEQWHRLLLYARLAGSGASLALSLIHYARAGRASSGKGSAEQGADLSQCRALGAEFSGLSYPQFLLFTTSPERSRGGCERGGSWLPLVLSLSLRPFQYGGSGTRSNLKHESPRRGTAGVRRRNWCPRGAWYARHRTAAGC